MDFKLTDKAKEKLTEMKQNQQPIKLKVTSYSWCGAELGIVSEKQSNDDKIYNIEGFDIIVSDELDGIVVGAEIDYSSGVFKKAFVINAQFS